jgi:hypothetical protein
MENECVKGPEYHLPRDSLLPALSEFESPVVYQLDTDAYRNNRLIMPVNF